MNRNLKLLPHERPQNKFSWFGLSLQHVFAMFGATILVPRLVGLDPSIALFASGLGTIIYIIITKGKVPIYLGSSFAFIPLLMIISTSNGDVSKAMPGIFSVGLVYLIVSSIIIFTKKDFTKKILPPVIIGPMIIIIALSIAPVAVDEIGLSSANPSSTSIIIGLITALTAMLLMIGNRKGWKLKLVSQIPILTAIVVGYVTSIMFGAVDFHQLTTAKVISLPTFQIPFMNYTPVIDFGVIIPMMIISIVTITENIGEHHVLSEIVGQDFLKNPGTGKVLLADGCAIIASAFFGGPVTTTYAENNSVIAITKVASVYVTFGAAVIAIILSFSGLLSALISTIPAPVLGGISLILFGMIANNGIKILLSEHVDLTNEKNISIISVMLILGVGGATLTFSGLGISNMQLSALALSAICGIVLNLILPNIKN